MAYIAQKPCMFAGRDFRVGDAVPDEFILPENRNGLVKMGVLAETQADTKAHTESAICVCDGERMLPVTQNGLQFVFDVMTKALSAAEPRIAVETDAHALVLLSRLDNRKTVKEAVSDRLDALDGAGEDQ